MSNVVGGKGKTISIEKAISIADNCLDKLTPLVKSRIRDGRLEGFGPSGVNWKITLSYLVEKDDATSVLGSIYGSNYEMLYKTFIVDVESEEVISMEDKKASK